MRPFNKISIVLLVIVYTIIIIDIVYAMQLSLTKEELLMNGKWVLDGNGFNFEPMNDQQKEQYIKEVTKQWTN